MRSAGELSDKGVGELVVYAHIMVSPASQTEMQRQVVYAQKSSLKRLRSPKFGRYDGKSSMMVPLLQSAPSDVLYVPWPRRS